MAYIMDLDFEIGIEIINKAIRERDKQQAWDMWLMQYQHMDKKTFVPFNKFYEQLKRPEVQSSTTPTKDIIAKAERIKAADQSRR